jgi:hypothetical protein
MVKIISNNIENIISYMYILILMWDINYTTAAPKHFNQVKSFRNCQRHSQAAASPLPHACSLHHATEAFDHFCL